MGRYKLNGKLDWHIRKRLVCTRVSYVNFARNTEGGLIETDSRPFDYGIPAELFMGKRKGGPRQPLRYRRFATAAEAIRFAVEELPACARWAPECRSVTNASMATTFNAFTRATISHCNGVCRSDCELTVGSL